MSTTTDTTTATCGTCGRAFTYSHAGTGGRPPASCSPECRQRRHNTLRRERVARERAALAQAERDRFEAAVNARALALVMAGRQGTAPAA